MVLVFFGERLGEEQNGAAEHEGVGNVVEAVADVGGDGKLDGEVDDYDYEQNCEAEDGSGKAGFLVEEETGAGDEQYYASEIGPEQAEWDPCWRDFSQGDAGGELRMQKMFDAEEDGCGGKAVASDGYEEPCWGCRVRLLLSPRKRESATAEREIS